MSKQSWGKLCYAGGSDADLSNNFKHTFCDVNNEKINFIPLFAGKHACGRFRSSLESSADKHISKLVLSKPYVSGTHFSICKNVPESADDSSSPCKFILSDSSSNGTYLNGTLVGKGKEEEIKNDDIISIRFKGDQKVIMRFLVNSDNAEILGSFTNNSSLVDKQETSYVESEELLNLRNQVKSLQDENIQQDGRITEQINSIEQLNIKVDSLQKDLRIQTSTNDSNLSEIVELKQTNSDMISKLSATEARCRILEDKLQESGAKLAQLRTKLESLHDEHSLDREKTVQDQKAEIERKAKQIEARILLLDEANQLNTKNQTDIKILQTKLSKSQSLISSLQCSKMKMEGELDEKEVIIEGLSSLAKDLFLINERIKTMYSSKCSYNSEVVTGGKVNINKSFSEQQRRSLINLLTSATSPNDQDEKISRKRGREDDEVLSDDSTPDEKTKLAFNSAHYSEVESLASFSMKTVTDNESKYKSVNGDDDFGENELNDHNNNDSSIWQQTQAQEEYTWDPEKSNTASVENETRDCDNGDDEDNTKNSDSTMNCKVNDLVMEAQVSSTIETGFPEMEVAEEEGDHSTSNAVDSIFTPLPDKLPAPQSPIQWIKASGLDFSQPSPSQTTAVVVNAADVAIINASVADDATAIAVTTIDASTIITATTDDDNDNDAIIAGFPKNEANDKSSDGEIDDNDDDNYDS